MNLIPLPYRILGAVLIALSLLTAGYFKGRSDANANCQTKIEAIAAKAQELKDAEITQANTASTKLEIGNAQAKIIYKTITQTVDRVVERPVYLNTCLDPDGLQLANAALAGIAAGPPSEPAATVPASGPAQ